MPWRAFAACRLSFLLLALVSRPLTAVVRLFTTHIFLRIRTASAETLWEACIASQRRAGSTSALLPTRLLHTQTNEEFEFLCDAILLSREGTEGPFYVEKELLRSDITEGRRGLPLKLEIMVIDLDCHPIPDVWIDLWQADASGDYSGYQGVTRTTVFTDLTWSCCLARLDRPQELLKIIIKLWS